MPIKKRRPALPPVDLSSLPTEIENELTTDRGLAVLSATLLEEVLENLIRKTMLRVDEKDTDAVKALNALFWDQSGAFGSLYQKIEILFVYGAIREPYREAMHCVRNIRNLFAHNQQHTFDDPDLLKVMGKTNGKFVDAYAPLFSKGNADLVARRKSHGRKIFAALTAREQFIELFSGCYNHAMSSLKNFPSPNNVFATPYEVSKIGYAGYVIPDDHYDTD
jgi:DNA-binding MltR family transcriptional regulator